MKRKLFVLCSSIAFLFAVCLGISACDKPLKELSAPQNIQQENRVLTWDKVDNASGYILFINGKEYETTENRFELCIFARGGDFTAKVMAIGDEKAYDDSPWANAAFSLEEPIEHGYDEAGWEYTFLEDELGYEVSKGNANLEGDVVIPDFFDGFPVVRLAQGAFSYYYDLIKDSSGMGVPPPAPNPYTGFLCNVTTTSLKLPSRLRSIGKSSLSYLLKVEALEIPETATEFGQGSFWGCLNLKHVNIPKGIKAIPESCFRETGIEELVLPNGLETIGRGAFHNPVEPFQGYHVPSNLTSVVIPDSVKTIENQAFAGRGNLRNVTMSNNVEFVGETAFNDTAWYNALPDGIIYLRNNEILYTYKGEMPEHTELIIPSSVKLIFPHAFENQTNLEKIYIPDGVKFIGTAHFAWCFNLLEVRLPSDLEEIPASCLRNTAIESIAIPKNVKKLGNNAFLGCKNLKEIVLNENLESMGDSVFSQCSSLISIILPSSLQNIGVRAFQSSSLSSIIIPNSVQSIGNQAFYACTSLTEIIFENANGWTATGDFINLENLPYIPLSAEELSSPTTAAQLLKTTYPDYTLTRE